LSNGYLEKNNGGFPKPSETSKPFWDACTRGNLVLQVCTKCMKFQWYPRSLCVRCGSTEGIEWRESKGKGIVYSFTIVRFPVQTYLNPVYYEGQFPYAVGLVELIYEKVRMYARIIECENSKIEIGMPVKVTFLKLKNTQFSFPAFRPSSENCTTKI
jgi:uncharacterized OB-fold protein